MTRCFRSAVLLGLVLGSGLSTLTWPGSAYGQAAARADVRQQASAYVMRTREIDQGDFTLEALPDQGSLKVYRASVTRDAAWIPGIERLFEVYVDTVTGEVAGEHSVRR